MLQPTGLNLKKLSSRHLKVFNPTKFYHELSAEMQKLVLCTFLMYGEEKGSEQKSTFRRWR